MGIGRGKVVVAMAAVVASAWLTSGSVQANQSFQQQTGKSCVDCHLPNQETLGAKGLNPMGQAFKDCGYKFGCAPPQNTTEKHQGMVTFSNTVCSGKTRQVALRPGGESGEGAILLFVEPGQRIKMGVSRGTKWTSSCEALKGTEQLHFLPLELVLD